MCCCKLCTPDLTVLEGPLFRVQTSAQPSTAQGAGCSFPKFNCIRRSHLDMCMQHLNLARNNDKTKKQCSVFLRGELMEPYNVFPWSRPIREDMCRSATVGDTMLSMLAFYGASSCMTSWCLWLHSSPAAWKQLQSRSGGMHGAPSHFKVVFLISGCLFKQDNRSLTTFSS